MSGEELVKSMGMEEAFRNIYTGEMDKAAMDMMKANVMNNYKAMEEAAIIGGNIEIQEVNAVLNDIRNQDAYYKETISKGNALGGQNIKDTQK